MLQRGKTSQTLRPVKTKPVVLSRGNGMQSEEGPGIQEGRGEARLMGPVAKLEERYMSWCSLAHVSVTTATEQVGNRPPLRPLGP